VNSLYDFIITPVESRYNNVKKFGDKELIVNTSIENFKAISTEAVIVSVPLAFKQPIKKGDRVRVHHNIFRRWYDVKEKERNSRSYFKEDLYFCSMDQVYLYKQDEWKCFGERCFITPLKSKDETNLDKTIKQKGIVKYNNTLLNEIDIWKGDVVSFKPEREFEFIIDNELLYCMKSKDIIIKHEHKGDEEIYNPSWTRSGEGTDKSSKRRNCRYRGGCVCGQTEKRSCH